MIKKLFLISLLNFVFVLGVVFIAKVVAEPTEIVSVNQTTTPAATMAPSATTTLDPLAGRCLVYIDGVRYDLTEFRNIHDGGNIFQCGTDMSNIFYGQHPISFLAKISQYKI